MAILFEVLNPLFWLSVAWIIFDIEAIALLWHWREWKGSKLPFFIHCPLAVVPSIITALEIINHPGNEGADFWILQFTYMPIPPWGCDSIDGISSVSDKVFLVLYPLVNLILVTFAYAIIHKTVHSPRTKRGIIRIVAISGLLLGKGIFEFIVILTWLSHWVQ